MQSNDDARTDRLETSSDLSRYRRTAVIENRPPPRDFNHWGIPGVVVTTALLVLCAAYHLLVHELTRGTLLLTTLAVVMLGTTVLYINAYLLQQSMIRDHQLLLDEVRTIQRQRRKDSEIVQNLLGQVLGRLDDANNEHWEAINAALRMSGGEGADVLPLQRRPGSYSGT